MFLNPMQEMIFKVVRKKPLTMIWEIKKILFLNNKLAGIFSANFHDRRWKTKLLNKEGMKKVYSFIFTACLKYFQ